MSNYVDIIGYEKLYKINREGSVWSYKYNKELKAGLSDGYYTVVLTKNKIEKTFKVHKLLALQFLPNPLNLTFIDHMNGIRTDNRLDNLRWVSSRQNNNNRTNNKINPLISITPSKTYQVRFRVNGKLTCFGNYKTLEEALSERDCALDSNGLLNYCYGFTPTNLYP